MLIIALMCSAIGQQAPPGKAKQHRSSSMAIRECFNWNFVKDDVSYIASGEDMAVWRRLTNDEERDRFIEQFWQRRDPTPDTYENEFRDQYYERIIAANERYGNAKQEGWKTDRGQIYVMVGEPDSIKKSDAAEDWFYRFIELPNLKEPQTNVKLHFVDVCHCGDLRLTIDEADKDTYPKQGSSLGGQKRPDLTQEVVDAYLTPSGTPRTQFPLLERLIREKLPLSELTMKISADFQRVTNRVGRASIRFSLPADALSWHGTDKGQYATTRVYVRAITLTGKIAEVTEKEFKVAKEDTPTISVVVPLYLYTGLYRLEVAFEDVTAAKVSTATQSISVPEYGWCD